MYVTKTKREKFFGPRKEKKQNVNRMEMYQFILGPYENTEPIN